MTTNKPEVKRYTPAYGVDSVMRGHMFMDECDHGAWVSLEDYEALQAECEELRKDAEFGRSILAKREPGKAYGCHCDLEEGMEPDSCVIGSGERNHCVYAKSIEVKEQCEYWRVIAKDSAIQEANP